MRRMEWDGDRSGAWTGTGTGLPSPVCFLSDTLEKISYTGARKVRLTVTQFIFIKSVKLIKWTSR